MSNSAYQFNSAGDALSFTMTSILQNVHNFTIALRYKFTSSALTGLADGHYLIFGQLDGFWVEVFVSGGTKQLRFVVTNGSTFQIWLSNTFPLVDDGTFYNLIWQWNGNPAAIDVHHGNAMLGDTTVATTLNFSGGSIPVNPGASAVIHAGGNTLDSWTVSLGIAEVDIWKGIGISSFMLNSTDIATYHAGYPGPIIEPFRANPANNESGPYQIDCFFGLTPWSTGFLNTMSVTTVGSPTQIAGPTLNQPYLPILTLKNSPVHNGGATAILIKWSRNLIPPFSVTFTPTVTLGGSCSPSSFLAPSDPNVSPATVSIPTLSPPFPYTGSVTLSNSQSIFPTVASFQVNATSLVIMAPGFPKIDPSGEFLIEKYLDLKTSNITQIVAVDATAGGAITDGTRTIQLNNQSLFDLFSPYVITPIFDQPKLITDEADTAIGISSCSLTGGTWNHTTYPTPSQTAWRNNLPHSYAVYGQLAYSSDAAATATYTLAIPHFGSDPNGNTYNIYTIRRDNFAPRDFPNTGGPYVPSCLDTGGGTPTAHAQVVVTDGAGNTQTWAIDQTTSGNKDLSWSLYSWSLLGTINANSGTLTFTLTRTVNDGTNLMADAFLAEVVPNRITSGSWTFSSNDNRVTCFQNVAQPRSAGTLVDTTGASSGALIMILSLNDIAPFNPSAVRKFRCGTNPGVPNKGQALLANLVENAFDIWRPGSYPLVPPATVSTTFPELIIDAYGRLTGFRDLTGNFPKVAWLPFNAGGNSVGPAVGSQPGFNGGDNTGLPGLPQDKFWLSWTNNGNFEATIINQAAAIGGHTYTSLSGISLTSGSVVPQNGSTPGPWPPNYHNGDDLSIQIISHDLSAPLGFKVYDSMTGQSPGTRTHPAFVAAMRAGLNGPIRTVNLGDGGIEGNSRASDYPADPGDGSGALFPNFRFHSVSPITAIEPVDTNFTTDADGVKAYYTPKTLDTVLNPSGGGWAIVKITCTDSRGLDAYQWIGINSTVSGDLENQPDNNSGTMNLDENHGIVMVLGPHPSQANKYLILTTFNGTYKTAGHPNTLANPVTLSGGSTVSAEWQAPIFSANVVVQWVVDGGCTGLHKEFGMAHILEPSQSTINYWVDAFCALTAPGIQLCAEAMNEPFNAGPGLFVPINCTIFNNKNSLPALDNFYGYGYSSAILWAKVKARMKTHGRDADFVPILNNNDQGYSEMIDAVFQWGTDNPGNQYSNVTASFPNIRNVVGGYLDNLSQWNSYDDQSGGITNGSYAPMGYNAASIAFLRLSPRGLISLQAWHSCIENPEFIRLVPAFAFGAGNAIYSRGRNFTAATSGGYEIAVQNTGHYGNNLNNNSIRGTQGVHDSWARQITLSMIQNYWEPRYSASLPAPNDTQCSYFTWNDPSNLGASGSSPPAASADNWYMQLAVTQPFGYGTTPTPTVVPGDVTRLTNQIGGALASYASGGASYYVAPISTSGAGSMANPFGIPDLITTGFAPGPALTILAPGDTLWFRAGTYSLAGNPGSGFFAYQILGPTVSGTPTQPITLRNFPGEAVTIAPTSGYQPAFGTSNPVLNYVRFFGFKVDCTVDSTTPTPAFALDGVGNEVAYCEVIGTSFATTDNHDGFYLVNVKAAWVHHNNIHGFSETSYNASAVKVYTSQDIIVEDNYCHGNYVGLFDKDSGLRNTYRRNYLVSNPGVSFYGNNQGSEAQYYIYDNVCDNQISLHSIGRGTSVYNNQFRGSQYGVTGENSAGGNVYQVSIWNNVSLYSTPITGYWTAFLNLMPPGASAPLAYMDYNVYDQATNYQFMQDTGTPATYNLAQMQADGFEVHSSVSVPDSSLYVDTANYVLKAPWTTAGRFGDPVGPRYPIASIQDTTRYGPAAFLNDPIVTLQPQSQTFNIGNTVTFNVAATGAGLFYQWQSTQDPTISWLAIQGANSASYTTGSLASGDSGTMFRCLISSMAGSVWTQPATVNVPTSTATTLTLSGPTSGVVGIASTAFLVTPNGTMPTDTVTPATSGSGSFSPTSLSFTAGSSASLTFSYTPSSTSGSPHLISITDTAGLTIAGSPIHYTVTTPTPTPTPTATGYLPIRFGTQQIIIGVG